MNFGSEEDEKQSTEGGMTVTALLSIKGAASRSYLIDESQGVHPTTLVKAIQKLDTLDGGALLIAQDESGELVPTVGIMIEKTGHRKGRVQLLINREIPGYGKQSRVPNRLNPRFFANIGPPSEPEQVVASFGVPGEKCRWIPTIEYAVMLLASEEFMAGACGLLTIEIFDGQRQLPFLGRPSQTGHDEQQLDRLVRKVRSKGESEALAFAVSLNKVATIVFHPGPDRQRECLWVFPQTPEGRVRKQSVDGAS